MYEEWSVLKKLSEAFGPSTFEDEVIHIIRGELESDYQIVQTTHKNLVAYKEQEKFNKTIIFQAHMDELGLRPYKYLPNGFIELTPTGAIPPSIMNHSIEFSPNGVGGVLIARKEEKKARFFADIGAKDDKEALQMVPYHANGAFSRVWMEESPTQLMGKSFDDRAGCAAIISVLKSWTEDSGNRLVGIFTAREETGNWPVSELYRTMNELGLMPDLIVNVECCPGGPTPDNTGSLAQVGKGIVLVNMDASYEPDPELCLFMDHLAVSQNIHTQHMAIRDGSGELGRLALTFGVAGYPLTIPVRYMHFPHSVMAKTDYLACIDMIRAIGLNYK